MRESPETITYKNWLAEDWSPTKKYKMREKTMIVTKVIGMSTIVRAAASMNG